MAKSVNMTTFNKQYSKWLDACLVQFNTRYGKSRKYHQETVPVDYDTGTFVEFSEDGSAYPHSNWGVGFIPYAVTSWENSEYYVV